VLQKIFGVINLPGSGMIYVTTPSIEY